MRLVQFKHFNRGTLFTNDAAYVTFHFSGYDLSQNGDIERVFLAGGEESGFICYRNDAVTSGFQDHPAGRQKIRVYACAQHQGHKNATFFKG
jgi:hypothetical protein